MNLNTIGSHAKIQILRDTLRAADVNIALFQELRTETWPDFYGYAANVTPAANGDSGAAILVRDGIVVEDVVYLQSARGLALTVQGIRLVNIYAPSGTDKRRERAQFYSEAITPLFLGRYENIIVGGDFNCVLARKDQHPNFTTCPELPHLVNRLSLVDTWETVH